jgi:uncharacterized protein YciI
MKVASLFGALLLAAPVVLGAQQASTPNAAPVAPPGFEIPKHLATESAEHTAMTRDHLKYIRRMIEEKKYVFAGPLLDGGDKQGIAIVAAASEQAARRIAEGDPAIAAGHMAVEMHPAMLPSLASLVVRY